MSGPFQRLTKPPDPHLYDEDAKAKVCTRCPLPKAHRVHDPAHAEADEQERNGWLAEDARRLGESGRHDQP